MPAIGWIIMLSALALVLGNLFMLRDTSNTMSLSDEKLKKVLKRKAELEAEEKEDD